MGANLEYKGIQEVINQIGLNESAEEPELSPTEIKNEWRRLASFMSNQQSFKSVK